MPRWPDSATILFANILLVVFLLKLLTFCYKKGIRGKNVLKGRRGNWQHWSARAQGQNSESSALFVPVLATSSSHAQNADCGGERVSIAPALELPRLRVSPPPLFTSLGEEPRTALINSSSQSRLGMHNNNRAKELLSLKTWLCFLNIYYVLLLL